MSSAWTGVIRLTRLSYRCSIEPLIAAAMVNTAGTGSNSDVELLERVIRGWQRRPDPTEALTLQQIAHPARPLSMFRSSCADSSTKSA